MAHRRTPMGDRSTNIGAYANVHRPDSPGRRSPFSKPNTHQPTPPPSDALSRPLPALGRENSPFSQDHQSATGRQHEKPSLPSFREVFGPREALPPRPQDATSSLIPMPSWRPDADRGRTLQPLASAAPQARSHGRSLLPILPSSARPLLPATSRSQSGSYLPSMQLAPPGSHPDNHTIGPPRKRKSDALDEIMLSRQPPGPGPSSIASASSHRALTLSPAKGSAGTPGPSTQSPQPLLVKRQRKAVQLVPGTAPKLLVCTSQDPALNVSAIHLEREEIGDVPVFDSCDTVRRRIRDFLATTEISQAAFLRAIAESYPDGRKFQGAQLHRFLSIEGPMAGNTSGVFYGAYVLFEKLRIRDKRPKSPDRLSVERLHPEGFNRPDYPAVRQPSRPVAVFDLATAFNMPGALKGSPREEHGDDARE